MSEQVMPLEFQQDSSRLIRLQLYGIGQERKPGEKFSVFLEKIMEMGTDEAVDVMLDLLDQVTGTRNPFYMKMVLRKTESFLDEHCFYLVEGINTILDYFMHEGDVRESFRILKLIQARGDSRTLEILQKYSNLYKDRSVVSRLIGYRNKLERKLARISEKLQNAEMEPILDPFQGWQGEIHA